MIIDDTATLSVTQVNSYNQSSDVVIGWNNNDSFIRNDTGKKINRANTVKLMDEGFNRIKFYYGKGLTYTMLLPEFLRSKPFTTDDNLDRMTMQTEINKTKTEINQPNRRTKMAAKKVTKPTEETKSVMPHVIPAKKRGNKVEAEATEKKAFGPRKAPEGHVSVSQLAEELGLAPAVLRRKLRSLEDIQREDGAVWSWKENSKELASIKKRLSA